MAGHFLRKALTEVGVFTSRPVAFLIVPAYTAVWLLIQPDSFDMHGLATLVVWIMTLFIQRAEHRDTQALHAKLDELLRAEGEARNELTRLDEKEPEEIEKQRSSERTKE